ncbi:pyridoxal phosphate-dependent aminotransferase [Clostridium niameyense]|uniref:pyridoxal phosphate-dependent aminotransferase n=1 Tax=Clostridium niameyense TaxID=1622073 RepID=UPI00067ECAC7|nr:histidinol-phosphate transaminase [Clostridium niameyense]
MHGGDIYTEGILKGKSLIDFSSNINPLGVSNSFKNHINEALEKVQVYPDIHYRSLKNNILDYLNFYCNYFYYEDYKECIDFTRNDLVLGNGAIELIDLAISTLKSITIVIPSFVEYELCAKKWNLKIDYCYLNKDMTFNYENIHNSLKKTEGIILGNPNNPNGDVILKEDFISILDYCEKNKKMVLIDEAFIEFTGIKSLSLLKLCSKYKCLFIIKALTKFFALPGIRFGYGISKNSDLIKRIKEKQNPWNVNSFVEVAVKYVLKDYDYIKNSIDYIEKERIIFIKELKRISTFSKVYDTYSNFILCELNKITADELNDIALNRGIIIRSCCDFKGLNNTFVRLAIKDHENNKKLINVLKNI